MDGSNTWICRAVDFRKSLHHFLKSTALQIQVYADLNTSY